jgi:hypothetical protein
MPTTLPDQAARTRRRHLRRHRELVLLVAAIVYLLVLGWNLATLEASYNQRYGHDPRQGEYNPMEPSYPIAGRRAGAPG